VRLAVAVRLREIVAAFSAAVFLFVNCASHGKLPLTTSSYRINCAVQWKHEFWKRASWLTTLTWRELKLISSELVEKTCLF
jgi:hypothetical protein